MTTRRAFLATLAAASLPRLGWADIGGPAYLAAARQGEGFALHGLSAGGESLFSVDLPGRGHAACAHPVRAEAVAFARRPGTFALVLDCATGAVLSRLTPPAGQQFNGHGTYAQGGALLLTSEVVAEGSAGRIGLWDVGAGYRRIGAWESGGIGPHDLRLLSDGRLLVANGGIATDPQDRSKLNIDTMRPNLTILSAQGRAEAQAELPADWRQNSIRHLAVTADDRIAFAMQWEGDPAEIAPVLGLWSPGGAVQVPQAGTLDAAPMRGYGGSIAWNAPGTAVAVTSPRGGAAMIHDAQGAVTQVLRRADVCGAAALGADFALTDGAGGCWRAATAAPGGLSPLAMHPGLGWDNHLVALARG